MLKNLPTESRFPVTQGFGEHPEIYADVLCGERGQLGHNGIDFGTPLGTPVIAVQHGSVLRTDFDSTGFGRYVVIGHAWGQTLYAHLSEVTIAPGQNITAGTRIGRSGSSGNSSGPHLHFGMRLQPYDMEDGWCGYSDPAPYLAASDSTVGTNDGTTYCRWCSSISGLVAYLAATDTACPGSKFRRNG